MKLDLNQKEDYKETELGLLPKDWEVVRLGEIAKISSGGSAPQGEEYFKGGKYPFIRVQHIDNEDYAIRKYDFITEKSVSDYKLKLYSKGTIVFPKSGASVYLEKRAMLPVDAYIVSHLCVVHSKKDDVLQNFLFYVLVSKKLAKEKASGYPTLNLSEVKMVKIPLPPLSEQKNIAYVLSSVQEAKEKTEDVIKTTKELKKSMMKHLFTYGPVSLEEAEKVPLKETEIGLIPEEWEVKKLENLVEFKNGLWKGKNGPFIVVKVLRNTNFNNDGTINFDNIAELAVEKKQFETREIKKNDIILERSGGGPKQPVGRVVFFEKEDNFKYSFSNFTSRLRVNNKEIIFPKYLFYFLFHFYVTGETNNYQNRTTGIRNLDFSKYKNILIPLPPLTEQKKIASILSAIDQKIEAEENKKKALEDLFKSLLYNLMTAKIRVNHLEKILD